MAEWARPYDNTPIRPGHGEKVKETVPIAALQPEEGRAAAKDESLGAGDSPKPSPACK
jgi:hypothetical protein